MLFPKFRFIACTALLAIISSSAHASYVTLQNDYPEAQTITVKLKATGKGTGLSVNDAIGLSGVQSAIDNATKPLRLHLLPFSYDFTESIDLSKTKSPLIIFEGIGARTIVRGPSASPIFITNPKVATVLRFFSTETGAALLDNQQAGVKVTSLTKVAPQGLVFPAVTRTVFVAPFKVGKGDGTNQANAMALADMLKTEMSPKVATRFHFVAGTYALSKAGIVFDKSSTAPVILEGEGDATVFKGVFSYPEVNAYTSMIKGNRSDIFVRKLVAQNVGSIISVATGAKADNVFLDDLTIRDSHQAISVNRNANFISVANWKINNVRILGYYEAGMRLSGKTTKNITITRTVIDGANASNASDCYKSGVQLLESISNVTMEDVKVMNNVGNCTGVSAYQQGDGIEADDKQGMPTNLVFKKVVVSNARDGGLDLKADNVLMEDLTVLLGASPMRYSLRLWSSPNYKCVRCNLAKGNGHLQSMSSMLTMQDPVLETADFKMTCEPGPTTLKTGKGVRIFRSGNLVKESYCR